MTSVGKILAIAIVMVFALTIPIAYAEPITSGPSTTPQYLTCTEVIPTISGGNLSHVIVWLRLNNVTTPNGLTYLLDQMYYNPSSPYFHKFITPQQFAQWYSPPSYVFSYIESLASEYGLVVNYTFPMLIEATGNASAVDNFIYALQAAPSNIQQWILSGECMPIGYFYAGSKAPTYKPQYELLHLNTTNINAVLHTNVITLNGVPLQSRYDNVDIWWPSGLEFIYDELPLFNMGYNGHGYTIAIVDAFGDFNFTLASQYVYQNIACNDLYTFDGIFGLPNPPSCNVIFPTGTPVLTLYNLGTAEGWSFETALDIEYAHTMAPGANILLVITPDAGDDLFVAIEYVVNKSLANFVSLSWASPEDAYYIPPVSYNLLYAYDEIFMQAAAEGIGVFAASGDWGAFDLSISPIEPSVWYPASDPWVTAVGGTSLSGVISEVTTSRAEYAWSWNPYYEWGTGGGYSFTFPETPGQLLIRIFYERVYAYEPDLGIYFFTLGSRGVPDIAADADPFTGVLIVINGAMIYPIGGTSLATPLSAGMTATVQSAVPGFTIGDLAPTLYLLYHYYPFQFYAWGTSFPTQDFYTGIQGALFPTMGGQNGLYWVIQGQWNPVDGLGQINVYGLAKLLQYFPRG